MTSSSATSLDYGRPVAKPAATGARAPFRARGAGVQAHRHAALKLVAATRGEGALVWSGGSTSVAYELDLFTGGAKTLASGGLAGDFARLLSQAGEHETARLRLQDGSEIAVELFGLEPDLAGFDAQADFATHPPIPGWRASSPA